MTAPQGAVFIGMKPATTSWERRDAASACPCCSSVGSKSSRRDAAPTLDFFAFHGLLQAASLGRILESRTWSPA